jgi:hypothetical protein
MPPTFQLFDSDMAQLTPDVFGVWETAPSEGVVSFAALEEAEEVPVWSVNLSPDAALAAHELDACLAQVATSRKALTIAESRIDKLVAQTRSQGEVSFSVSAVDLPPAESDLLAALDQIKGGDTVSFGLLDEGQAALGEAQEKFQRVMERVAQALIYYALVETRLESRLVGKTGLTWAADAQTLWASDAPPEYLALHRRTLALTIASRNALMRTFMLTAQGAVKLSALLATPGGAVLALPVAWKFINQVMAEVGHYLELRQTQPQGV